MKNYVTLSHGFLYIFLLLIEISLQGNANKVPAAFIDSMQKNATVWSTQCTSLTPASLELLANFVYLSYRHAHLDAQTSNALIELKKLLPSLRIAIRSDDNPMPISKAYLHASKRFFAYNGLRYHIYMCWQQCVDHLESVEDPTLQNAYEALQRNGQQIITNYLATNTTVPVTLKQLQQQMKHATNQMHILNVRIETMFEKMVTNTQPEDSIIDTDHALAVNNQLQDIIDYLYTPCSALDEHQVNLLSISTQFFYHYYCVLHPYLSQEEYRRIVFGPHGMLTENYVQLPSPSHMCI